MGAEQGGALALMFLFAHPAWLALLPLLALAAWRSGRRSGTPDGNGPTLVHPNLAAFHAAGKAPPVSRWPRWLAAGALGLLVVALAQPQWLGPWIQRVPTGRDLVLLVDTSATMSIRDFQWQGRAVERISVLKALVNRFVTARPADRFGVIAFGSVAGTLVPPTFDRDLLTGMIRRLQVGIAGQNTALGDAIALGLKQLHGQAQLRPAFILFSDGGDSNAGQMTTREAVELARKDGVAVYTVAISSRPDTAVPAAAADTPGDAQPNLRQIAQLTGGRYYRAGTTGALRNVIDAIGEREKTVPRAPTRRAVQQWYLLPLLLAVLLFCVARLMGAGGVDP